MDLAKIIGNYIRHLRKQSVHNQRLHAFSISGLFTMIIAVLWLHFYYGFWSNDQEQVYPKSETYETRSLTEEKEKEETRESPGDAFKDFMDNLQKRIQSVPLDFKETVSDTETFERIE